MVETGEKSLALAYGINSLIRQENISNKAEQTAQVPFHLCAATEQFLNYKVIAVSGLLEYHAAEMKRLHITLKQTDRDCDSWIISLWAVTREMNEENVTGEAYNNTYCPC